VVVAGLAVVDSDFAELLLISNFQSLVVDSHTDDQHPDSMVETPLLLPNPGDLGE
jgi:hypothetical protein